MNEAQNPHRICTWNEESVCIGCGIRGELNCRWNSKALRLFVLKEIPLFVVAAFGMALVGVLTGVWWPLIVFAAGCVAFFGLGIETRILCTHCPYYAEEGKTLHCLALHGSPKLWRYRPEPMNRAERIALLSFFSFPLFFPIIIEAYGIWFMSINYGQFGLIALLGIIGITLANIMAIMQWILIMMYAFCSRCVNFSCPLNLVPESIVYAYLERNPVMKEAWMERLRNDYIPQPPAPS